VEKTLSVPGSGGAAPRDTLHQSFADATVPEPVSLPDQILPDVTMTGKSVGKLYEEAVRTWDTIRFVSADGKRISYTATIDTELGTIDILFLPDAAPNHVRSFLVLAKLGYYNGLLFERAIHDQSDIVPEDKVEYIEGGCPSGTGNPGYGSIGYWLKPEFSKELKHEEGSIGACLGETIDTGACRFYITLTKAPVMDGNRTIFAKVVRGLDVARKIATQPVANTAEFPDGSRPEHPVVIRKVTVQAKVTDQTAARDNK
jgi:cyclophilin family peptidyl-prolyl cis-trans isomerase